MRNFWLLLLTVIHLNFSPIVGHPSITCMFKAVRQFLKTPFQSKLHSNSISDIHPGGNDYGIFYLEVLTCQQIVRRSIIKFIRFYFRALSQPEFSRNGDESEGKRKHIDSLVTFKILIDVEISQNNCDEQTDELNHNFIVFYTPSDTVE